jgi:predicted nucleic acid-binding protein
VAVDAASFVSMRRERIGLAFTFDHHFAAAPARRDRRV